MSLNGVGFCIFLGDKRNIFQSSGIWHWVLKGEEEFSGLSCLPTARGQGVYHLDFHQTHLSQFPQGAHDVRAHRWVGMGRLGFLEGGSAAV